MAILTKFLQLLKPERNDYVDVEKHLSENYDKIDSKIEKLTDSNDKKLDKGENLSEEFNTGEKIEKQINKKLDKGNVSENFNSGEKIELEVKKKFDKGTLPVTVESAETILDLVQGNGGLKFDDALLYLNDAGTKKVGYYYLDKLTDGIFECITQTTTTVNNASYFKNISNKSNSDKLENLIESGKNEFGYYRKYSDGFIEQWGKTSFLNTNESLTIILPMKFSSNDYIVTSSQQIVSSTLLTTDNAPQIFAVTNESFKIHCNDAAGVKGAMSFSWHCVGY